MLERWKPRAVLRRFPFCHIRRGGRVPTKPPRPKLLWKFSFSCFRRTSLEILKFEPIENLFRHSTTGIAYGFRAGRRAAACGRRMTHRGAYPPLFFRGELEDVIHQELGLILIIALERRRRRTREDPVIVLALEQTGRHGGARADGLWVNDPAFHPIGFQTPAGLQEVGGGGGTVVSRIAGSVAFQAGRCGAAEEAPRHFGFLGGQHGDLFRYVGEGLARQGW